MANGDVTVFRHLRRSEDVPDGWHIPDQCVANYHAQFSLLIAKDEMVEALPDDNPKTVHGTAKPGLHAVPTSALLHLGQAMEDGRRKYGLMNWRKDCVSASTYYNAALRHLMDWWDGRDIASDSGIHHLAHAMACMAIVLDADEIGKLNDDRPMVGNFQEIVKRLTKEPAA